MNIKKIYQKEDGFISVILKLVFIIAVIVAFEYMEIFALWVERVIQGALGVAAILMFAQVVTKFKKGESYILFEEDGVKKVTKWGTIEKGFYTDRFEFHEKNGVVRNILVYDKNDKSTMWISNTYEMSLDLIKKEIKKRQKS